jgi:hypothetical protein
VPALVLGREHREVASGCYAAFEAPSITIAGQLMANGGGGASLPSFPARVGNGANSKRGGGGGGGAGRIWLRYRAATPLITTGAVISPPQSTDSTMP